MKQLLATVALVITAGASQAGTFKEFRACDELKPAVSRINPTTLSDQQNCYIDLWVADGKTNGRVGSFMWFQNGDARTAIPVLTIQKSKDAKSAVQLVVNTMVEDMLRGQLEMERELIADLQAQIDTLQPLADSIPALNAEIADLELQLAVATGRITQLPTELAAEYNRGFAEGAASVTPEDGVSQTDVDAAHTAGFNAGVASVDAEDGIHQSHVDAAREAGRLAGIASVTAEDGHHSTIVDSGTDTSDGVSVFMVTGELPSATTGRFVRAESYENAVIAWNIQRQSAINTEARLTAERDAANATAASETSRADIATGHRNSLLDAIAVEIDAELGYTPGVGVTFGTNFTAYNAARTAFLAGGSAADFLAAIQDLGATTNPADTNDDGTLSIEEIDAARGDNYKVIEDRDDIISEASEDTTNTNVTIRGSGNLFTGYTSVSYTHLTLPTILLV